MATVVEELVIALGLDIKSDSVQAVKRFSDGLSDIAKTAAKVGAAITAAASSALYLAERLNQTTASIGNFSQLTGISTRSMQALGVAVEQIGGNFQSVQADLMGLTKSMSSPVPGEFNQTLFQLGINVQRASGELKTADEILMDIAGRFRGMGAQEQLQWGSRLGLSNDTIRLLQAGSGEIARLKREAENLPTIVGEQNIKNAQLFVQQFSMLRRVLLFIGQEASSFAGPALQGIVRDVSDWLKTNRHLVESGLQAFIEGAIQGFRSFWEVLVQVKNKFNELFPGITEFIGHLWNSKLVAAIVEAGLAALTVGIGVMTAAYAPAVAAIAAALLVLNDFIVYLQGGNSMIGEMIKWVGSLYETFSDKFPHIATFIEILGRVFKDLGQILWNSVIAALEKVFGWLEKIGGVIGTIFNKVMGFINHTLDYFGYGKGGESSEALLESLDSAVATTQSWKSGGGSSGSLTGGKSSGNAPSGPVADRMKEGMNYFMSQGLSREQAAGIMGNLMHESYLKTDAVGDTGKAKGIAQWHPDRYRALLRFSSENGLNPNDYRTQLAFIMHEFQTTENKAYAALLNTNTVAGATEAFSSKYERPGNPMMTSRMSYARDALNTARMPGSVGFGGGNNTSTVNITNNIQANGAEEIAQKTTKKINYDLQKNYPGGLAPVTG